jgi:hypothetical protein
MEHLKYDTETELMATESSVLKNPICRRHRFCVRKIKIGSIDFIDGPTPLVILAFCTEQMATVSLLSNGKVL